MHRLYRLDSTLVAVRRIKYSQGMSTMSEAQAKIAARRKSIKDQIAELNQEDAELATASRALARLEAMSDSGSDPAPPVRQDSPLAARPSTTREMIAFYLSRTPELWRTANDIRDNVSDMKGADVPMSSISPTLSDMKNAGVIVRSGMRVALSERVRKESPDFFNENGEAETSPETGEPASSPIETQTSQGVFE